MSAEITAIRPKGVNIPVALHEGGEGDASARAFPLRPDGYRQKQHSEAQPHGSKAFHDLTPTRWCWGA